MHLSFTSSYALYIMKQDLQGTKLHNFVCIHTETRLRRGSQNCLCALVQRMGLHLAVPQKSDDVGESRRTGALHHVAGEYQQTRGKWNTRQPFTVFVVRTFHFVRRGRAGVTWCGSRERRWRVVKLNTVLLPRMWFLILK